MRLELCKLNVVADTYVADEVEAWRLCNFFERVLAVLDFRVVGCYAESYETVRNRQLLVHVDDGILYFVEEAMRSVEAGRPRAYDGYAQAIT